MSNIQVFNYMSDKKVRVIEQDGQLWFVAKDVCDILEIRDVTSALRTLDDDEKLIRKISGAGQNRDMATISEPGLYKLIFRSNKPEAKEFKRWVTHEVLPDIRKHGLYLGQKVLSAAASSQAEFDAIVRNYLKEKDRREALEAQIESERAYTNLGHLVMALPGSITVADAAQFLRQHGIEIGRNRLYKKAREAGLLSKQKRRWNKPTQKGIESGIVNIAQDNEAGFNFTPCTMVTPKGLKYLQAAFYRSELPLLLLFETAEEAE